MSKVDVETTIADVLGSYLAVQCEVLLSINCELRTALAGESPRIDEDQIHDARVACRRLRSLIRIFADVFSEPEADRFAEDTQWYGLTLGAIRDLDVLRVRLESAVDQLDERLVLNDARGELRRQLDSRRGLALDGLRDVMHGERYADLTEQLRRWKPSPPWTPEADRPANRIKKYVRKADRRLARRLERAVTAIAADDPEADELIHSARKAGKRARYATEASLEVLGPAAEAVVADRKELQDLLGDYQDSRLASVFLRDLGGIPGRNGFTFGVLFAGEAEHRRRLRKQIVKRTKRLR
ncbi:CHAD domain-containing protein [Microlunatus sp. Gsoil 973]|uniref:CHAD domain-containing protein n=1 Tax=Microlunatus sp. Gsoil 973 TaxID=2672569 RepID=UPI0018A83A8E|nr:CHAD domain-containing protein [Microlunatus sp. Gsoil 973]